MNFQNMYPVLPQMWPNLRSIFPIGCIPMLLLKLIIAHTVQQFLAKLKNLHQ